ncbi:lysine exporter LysO family protein [Veronia pacifica]|uniref:Surface protein n=1 Tax=Veronia pacifica TaxID=1080227 RepID=A0A1C3EPK8_9GAMM|nr:lysine exporter LysO family protein [Veronia pacifica]ODA35194.1 hypothetical protein A8L45_04580 [Veronia pacifica]
MFPDVLTIFIPLVFGYLLKVKGEKRVDFISKSTSRLVFFILGLMGLSLASLDNLGQNVGQILILAAVFFVCIGGMNLLTLPILDLIWKTETSDQHQNLPLHKMVFESLKLVVVVGLGLIIGLTFNLNLGWVDKASEYILLLLLFLIGIQLRNSGMTLKQIVLNKKGMASATVVVFSSLFGGIVGALILDIPINHGLAMASGFGWYSLAGILMGDGLGPIYGGASFLLELSREMVALVLIPILISRYTITAIGYGGATSMDFTLPVIQSSGGIRCVPIAIVSGFILSLLVPVLMLFFLSFG